MRRHGKDVKYCHTIMNSPVIPVLAVCGIKASTIPSPQNESTICFQSMNPVPPRLLQFYGHALLLAAVTPTPVFSGIFVQ